MKKVAVLGAGISGLAAAWFLKKRHNIELTLFEKNARAGGLVRTLHHQGFLFEAGPRGFRPSGKGKKTLELVHDLGLESDLVSSNPRARCRYIWLDGKLRRFGLGFLLQQRILGAALRDLKRCKTDADDETISDFVARRFNKRLADNLIDPLIKGIFGGDSQKLSMRSCFPLIWNFEKQKGSVIRGLFAHKKERSHPVSLYTFKRGMETLTQTLVEKLQCPILFSKKVTSLTEVDADIVVSALPTSALAHLLNVEDPVHYNTLSTVNFGWKEDVLKKKGYGFLVPSREKGEILGMTWDSEIFPHMMGTRICVMISGEDSLQEKGIRSLKDYLGITKDPDAISIEIARHAIPQYALNHHQKIEAFKKNLPPNVYALGSYFEGVGLNDCIFNAQKFAEELHIPK